MVKLQPSKLAMRVRFSLPALNQASEPIRANSEEQSAAKRSVVRDFLRFLGTRADIRLEALRTDEFLKSPKVRSPQTANLTIRKRSR
jgi:hypothetical protein